ncbi:hypothetical protein PFISCL1PPCAC_19624 [Pristionchus fissidentatus]|uniref:Beta-catenin-like protein 1 n=1 Tax=Pristionchus fissidentatus TaxID=1538716 RepID=A0AAV5W945_9BILA|nr:hypothetical protein PFISCL1PPCAC_19624 [Pristionchus fissidentatus]
MSTIDVAEILRASREGPPVKRPRKEEAPSSSNGDGPMDAASMLAALEGSQEEIQQVDEALLKKLTLQLEKRWMRNREMRVKHSDDPPKFMDSELELNTAIQELHCLPAEPDLFDLFIQLKGPNLLVSLLTHENSDIIGAALNLIKELIEDDGAEEEDEKDGVTAIVNALLQSNILDSIVSALTRLDESNEDDADAVHYALKVVDMLLEMKAEVVEEDVVSSSLFQWVLKRSCHRGPFDANKQYASELLSVILQQSEKAKSRLSDKVDGMDLLLRALAAYKKKDPSSGDEKELMENMFDSLCAALMWKGNRKKFLEGEGLQLMNLMLRERKQSRQSALKVLDHATTGPEGADNCAKFVEILGLRTLFPLLMRTPAKAKRKDTTPDEHEEHVVAILSSLMRSCEDASRVRIMQKFTEHEHEKVDRAVELLLKYRDRVQKWESKQGEVEDPELFYLDKMDAGLYTLQNTVLVLSEVCVHMNSARIRAIKLLKMKSGEERLTKHLVPTLAEYQENLGEDADTERDRVDLLIAKLTAAEKAAANAN